MSYGYVTMVASRQRAAKRPSPDVEKGRKTKAI
jgi:hypothetical protein